ncbi:hypothetical protein TNCV_3741241 [Trichonephila clavipes]|nr:hypothetical protein TNCV_3741241 [Trichonephila clavipes]
MGNPGRCGSNSEAPGKSRGRCPLSSITTVHHSLGVHLHWPGLVADKVCPPCGHDRMDGQYLLQCTEFDVQPTEDILGGPESNGQVVV